MRAETNSCIHVHVHDMLDRDDCAASSTSTSPCVCCDRAPQHRANGLCDREVWKRKGSMGMKGEEIDTFLGSIKRRRSVSARDNRLAGRVTGGGLWEI